MAIKLHPRKYSVRILFFFILGFMLLSSASDAMTVCVRPLVYNCAQTDTNQLQFDVYIRNVGTDTLGYRGHTLRFTMNREILPQAVPVSSCSVTLVPGTGDNRLTSILTTYNSASSVNIFSNYIQVNMNTGGTIYNQFSAPRINPGDSIWMGTLRVTAPVQWVDDKNTNPVWLSGTITSIVVYDNPPSSSTPLICNSLTTTPTTTNGVLQNGTNGGIDPCNTHLVSGFVPTCTNPPTASAGSSQSVCSGGSVYLTGIIGGSATSCTWSAPNGSFSNPHLLNTYYTPSIPNGNAIVTLTTDDPDNSGPCNVAIAYDTIHVVACSDPNGPTVCVRPLTYNCYQSDSNQIQLDLYIKNTGIDILGYKSHSFKLTMNRNILPVSPTPATTVTLVPGTGDVRLASAQSGFISDVILSPTRFLVRIFSSSSAFNRETCPLIYPGDSIWLGTFRITASTAWYSNSNTGSEWLVGTLNTITVYDNPPYDPFQKLCLSTINVPEGNYGKLENATNGGMNPCDFILHSSLQPLHPLCTQPATVKAGAPQAVCTGGTIAVSGSIGGSATSASWSSNDGTFINPTSLQSFFTPSGASTDMVLVLTTNDPDGSGFCNDAVSSLTVTLEDCPLSLNLRIFFASYYSDATHDMSTAINPPSDPSLFDLVNVELYQPTPPYNKFYESSGLLDIHGYGNFRFPSFVSGNSYYLVIRHRNSLQTWSKVPVSFTETGASYDFTSQ